MIDKEKSLAHNLPELAEEWHPTKNQNLSPLDVAIGSSKKVWWLGKCGHEWDDTISHRAQGRGCPYCSSKRVLKGFNDLGTLYPQLVDEWHPTKNGAVTPYDITSKSGKKVWWKCSNGHEWEALVSNRTKNKSSCPYCKGKKPILGVNDLLSVSPQLALEWHPTKNGDLKPSDMMGSSKRRIWWKCSKGHEWKATLDSRSKGHGCPYCSGRYATTGVNDLRTLRPDIAKYWHPTKNKHITPDSVTVASGIKYWWIGDCGHEWQTSVAHMCNKATLEICPVCSSQNRTSFPEQAIFYYAEKLFPDSISRYSAHKKELDVYIPSLHVGIEYDGMRFHTEETILKEQKKDEFFKNMGIQIFRLKERDDPDTICDGFSVWYRPWNNYKRLNHALEMLFTSIISFCGIQTKDLTIDVQKDTAEILSRYLQKRRADGFAAKHPELLKEWHPTKNGDLDPWLISEKSNHKFWWKCSEGHEWRTSVNERVGHKTGCPYCYQERRIRK